MPLKDRIDALLDLPDDELGGPRAADLEDAVQRGLAAVQIGELWVSQLGRALAEVDEDPERRAAVEDALESSRESVAEVRGQVALLHARAQELGVGAPASL